MLDVAPVYVRRSDKALVLRIIQEVSWCLLVMQLSFDADLPARLHIMYVQFDHLTWQAILLTVALPAAPSFSSSFSCFIAPTP